MSMTKQRTNMEQYYNMQMDELANADFHSLAQTMGLEKKDDEGYLIKFFNRNFYVSKKGVFTLDSLPISLEHKSIIAHYILSQGVGEFTGDFLPISRLTGMVSAQGGPSDHLVKPLLDNFGNNYNAFKKAAEKIGGQAGGKSLSGGDLWLFKPLEKLPLQIVFFEEDDEFPAEIKVLFDSSARNFVAYECLELLEIALVIELLAAAGLLGCGSFNMGGFAKEENNKNCGCGDKEPEKSACCGDGAKEAKKENCGCGDKEPEKSVCCGDDAKEVKKENCGCGDKEPEKSACCGDDAKEAKKENCGCGDKEPEKSVCCGDDAKEVKKENCGCGDKEPEKSACCGEDTKEENNKNCGCGTKK